MKKYTIIDSKNKTQEIKYITLNKQDHKTLIKNVVKSINYFKRDLK